jgi:hypothetical protein
MKTTFSRALASLLMLLFALSPVWATCGGGGGGARAALVAEAVVTAVLRQLCTTFHGDSGKPKPHQRKA